jgi:hypothetical protein
MAWEWKQAATQDRDVRRWIHHLESCSFWIAVRLPTVGTISVDNLCPVFIQDCLSKISLRHMEVSTMFQTQRSRFDKQAVKVESSLNFH